MLIFLFLHLIWLGQSEEKEMADIIEFRKKEQRYETKAHCIGCGHEWIASIVVGTSALECPNCHGMKGHTLLEFGPPENTPVFTCECGNQYFVITETGYLCPNCGIYYGKF